MSFEKEYETIARLFGNKVAMQLPASNDSMLAVRVLRKGLPSLIAQVQAEMRASTIKDCRRVLRGPREKCQCHEKNQAQFDLLEQGKL